MTEESAPAGWLVYEDGDGFHAIPLRMPGFVIGRDPTQCDVAVRDFGISRRHARIDVGPDGRMTLSDLKSKGGSFVNERAVTAAPIVPGDRLRLGMVRFTVSDTPPMGAR